MASPRPFFKVACVFRVACALLAALFLAAPLGAQAPDEAWRTLTTEHFRVTFPAALEHLGRRAADRAERAYVALTERFVPPPGGRIDLLITDHTDVPNGFARVTPTNRITIIAAPPVSDPNLGYFDEWLELVIDHELVHIFHMDRTRGLGTLARSVFGRVPGAWPFFPGLGLPRWAIEGMAVWYESSLTHAGRVRGTFQEAQLRTALLEGRFEDLAQAAGDSPVWPGGTRYYTYGSHFFDYLLRAYGEEKMGTFVDAVAGQWVPYRLDAAGKKAFGIPLSRAWRDWRKELEGRFADLDARLRSLGPITEPERLTRGSRIALYPKPSPDGERLAVMWVDGRWDSHVRLLDPEGGDVGKVARTNGLATLAWLPGGDLLVSQLELEDPYRSFDDLYRVSPTGAETRLTSGARLTEPSVAPDGTWAVAVRRAGGTTALVRVDLPGGAVEELVPADLDTHWTFPAVSPDGRWIAVSRWRPGAYMDVVVLDARGREVLTVTDDRAVDLAPAWSADGAWLVWGSDRTGIPNILAARVDPEAGTAGEIRLATNVRTAAAYPAVDPRGRWLYFNGYHVDGWEVERIPFQPEAWPKAPPGDGRFRAPRRTAAEQDAELPGEVEGYSSLPTLLPRYWEPMVREAVRTPAIRTQDLNLRGRQILGPAFGARTSGQDLVGRHSFAAFGRVFSDGGGRWDGGLAWSWAGLGNPILSLSTTQFWDDDGPRVARAAEDAPLDTLFVLERQRSVGASLTFRRPRFRKALVATVGGSLVWESRELLDNDLNPSTDYALRRPSDRLGDLSVTLSYSTARSHSFQFGLSQGFFALVQGRSRRHFALADSLAGRPGVDRSFDEVLGLLQAYRSFDGPGFASHVLALRGSVGYARGPDADAGHFEVGGAAGQLEALTGLALFGGSRLFFPVRGYDESTRFGRFAWSVSGEYRIPLFLVHRGLGAWPAYMDRIFGSLFFDAGNAWGPELGVGGFQNPRRSTLASAGAELTTGLLTFWRIPLRVRLGGALPLVEGDGPRFYVRLGISF